jgi:hypothetical protein
LNFPTTSEILTDWANAVAQGTSGFQAFHLKYSALNQLGCTIGQAQPAATIRQAGGTDLGLLLAIAPFMGLMLFMPGWRRTRRSEA